MGSRKEGSNYSVIDGNGVAPVLLNDHTDSVAVSAVLVCSLIPIPMQLYTVTYFALRLLLLPRDWREMRGGYRYRC